MKIAVTYDNGEVFQHFGHSAQFKIYEVENNKVVKSEVVSTKSVEVFVPEFFLIVELQIFTT